MFVFCARANLHQQKCALKLCSATLRLIIDCPQAMTPVTRDILAISYTPAAGVARFENFNSKHVHHWYFALALSWEITLAKRCHEHTNNYSDSKPAASYVWILRTLFSSWGILRTAQSTTKRRILEGLKGHCHDKAHVRSWLTSIIFLTNKNRNTITRATNSPWVSLEFHAPFENLLSAGIWPFVCKEYLSCLCCVKAVSVEYKYKYFTFFQLGCTSQMCVLPSFLCFFSFLSKEDGYGAKVVFVSSRFENLLSRKA